MKYSDTSNKDGIIQNCESLCSLGDAGITGNSVLFAKFNGWINDAYGKVAEVILRVDKNWRWDDSNWGSDSNQALPVATCNLVSGQRTYILPRATNSSDYSTLWKVYKVRIKDTNGEWYDLEPLASDAEETADGSATGSGRPTKYRLIRNTIRLSDPPLSGKVTLTAGIQVWFQREFDRFTVSDTTQQPGFISIYHHLLAFDASATFFLPTNSAKSAEYLTLFQNGLKNLESAYAQRNDDPQVTKRLKPNVENNK